MMMSVSTLTLGMGFLLSSVAVMAGRAGQHGQVVGPAGAVHIPCRWREARVAKGQDRVAVVLGQGDGDGRGAREYGWGAAGRFPAEREDDAPVGDQFDELAAHHRVAAEPHQADAAGARVKLGRCPPPVTDPFRVGPVPPDRRGPRADPDRALHGTALWAGQSVASRALRRLVRSRAGHSSRSAAAFSAARRSDHICSTNAVTSLSPSRRQRYSRWLPAGLTVTSPASARTRRCWETAGRLMPGNWSAISPAATSSSRTSQRIARRVGSASARKVPSIRHLRPDPAPDHVAHLCKRYLT